MAARGKMLSIDFSAFSDYAEKLDKLGADLKKVVEDAMENAGQKVQQDVTEAMDSSNLPARGKYSQGETKASIIRDPKVVWHGSQGEMDLGFDKTKPGAGGFLITGTPKMKPDYKLEDIFSRKKYVNDIMKRIRTDLQDEIEQKMGG